MTDEVRRYFNRAAEEFDAIYTRKGRLNHWIDRHFRSDMHERYRLAFESCGDVSGKTVLDIGCGSGRYVIEFALRGAARVVGLDFAPRMLALAKERAAQYGVQDHCEFVCGDFMDVEFRQAFDDCVAIGVLDYVAKPQSFLTKMRALTAERLILTFPSRSFIRMPIRKIRYWFKRCPVHFYERADIQALLEGFGSCQIVKIPGQGMDYFVSLRISG